MRAIDLTHSIHSGMMNYPGDPAIVLDEVMTHEKDHCHVDYLAFGSHTGTHIDAPYHFLSEGKRITDFPVSKFIGDGIAINLTDKKAGEEIKPADLEPSLEQIRPEDFVVLQTGWYKKFGTEVYLDHPYVSANAAELLVNKGVSIVAVDFMSVDPTLWAQWDVHPMLLGNDVLIVENINNSLELEAGRRYQFFFAPIRLQDSDGGPIRALAIQEE